MNEEEMVVLCSGWRRCLMMSQHCSTNGLRLTVNNNCHNQSSATSYSLMHSCNNHHSSVHFTSSYIICSSRLRLMYFFFFCALSRPRGKSAKPRLYGAANISNPSTFALSPAHNVRRAQSRQLSCHLLDHFVFLCLACRVSFIMLSSVFTLPVLLLIHCMARVQSRTCCLYLKTTDH